jgi:hypothetical protein
MSKSPIKFIGVGAGAGLQAALVGSSGTTSVGSIAKGIDGFFGSGKGRMNKLENQMKTVMRDRNNNYRIAADDTQPAFATEVQGPVAENIIQNNPTNFNPNTINAASSMFGEEIPGSFDRNMGENILN